MGTVSVEELGVLRDQGLGFTWAGSLRQCHLCVYIYIYICSRKGFLLVIGLSLNNSSGEACSLFVYVCGGKEGEGYGRLIILSLCWVGLSCFG